MSFDSNIIEPSEAEVITQLQCENQRLKLKIYALEHRLSSLEAVTLEQINFPRHWKISPTRQDILRLALRNYMITPESVSAVCPRGDESENLRNLAGVHIFHINRGLESVGVKARLENMRGVGWLLSKESKEELKAILTLDETFEEPKPVPLSPNQPTE